MAFYCTNELTNTEQQTLRENISTVLTACRRLLHPGDIKRLKTTISRTIESGRIERDVFGFHPLVRAMQTAALLCDRIGPDRELVIASVLHAMHNDELTSAEGEKWGVEIDGIVKRLNRVHALYRHHPAVESENFKKLLLTFAEDLKVILLMIAMRLSLMQSINRHPLQDMVVNVAREARYLYAPLAHRLGLYGIKSELEDLAMKYIERETYTTIARRLNETKAVREKYITNFIAPVKKRLEAEGLKFEIKGRTKSISSIWNKIKKQRTTIDGIYDLFAIRIIIDAPIEREKPACWLAYSVVTDMFRPNPSRMKDWISIPKANGYESLHTTVYGPDQRWVEVQIRTRRMDEVAEKGLAAHWKYKGIRSEQQLDSWMAKVRDMLESADDEPGELMKNMKLDVYDNEVFVFTPKGDLLNLPAGATLLDFAFNVHTGLGAKCTGGRVNGKARKLNYRLTSGDTVDIMTSPLQQPKQDWLNFVVTSKARNKIRTALKEQAARAADYGKELLQRRLKNRKTEISEADLSRFIKKKGYKTQNDFFRALGEETLDISAILAEYELFVSDTASVADTNRQSADTFIFNGTHADTENIGQTGSSDEVLVIGDGKVKGISYRPAKCCNPIFGDDVFGFVSAEGVVKIHREDCPNAANIKYKYPYRIIRTRWSGSFDGQMAVTLRIVGKDDIGIVTNITSVITKHENHTSLRNISIDSHDGLFSGYVTIGVKDTTTLKNLIKKIRAIKGVKDVQRAN